MRTAPATLTFPKPASRAAGPSGLSKVAGSSSTTCAQSGGLSTPWLLVAVGSLLVSGVFALLLVVGRVPPFSGWIADADFYRRCLVVHVNLSLLVWLSGFSAAIYGKLNGRWIPVLPQAGLGLAGGGVLAMAGAAFVPGSSPILSNYIPFIDHPLFYLGLIAFLIGLSSYYLSGLLAIRTPSDPMPELLRDAPEASPGIQTAAIAFLLAVTTLAASWAATERGISPEGYFELVAWGGGHVLQVANVAAMLTLWLLLLRSLTGHSVIAPATARVLFTLLLLPHLVSPLLTLHGTRDGIYLIGFTRLMQFGIFPIVTVFLVLCIRALTRERRDGRLARSSIADPRLVAWILSVTLTLTGFLLGSMIRGSNTLIPAHYHASIGAITVVFMCGAYYLIGAPGKTIAQRWISIQLTLFGVGQLLFALGFAVGGTHGLGRKEYGQEQVLYSMGEYVGIAMMGTGGLIAVSGGVAFLFLFAMALRSGRNWFGPTSSPQISARIPNRLHAS